MLFEYNSQLAELKGEKPDKTYSVRTISNNFLNEIITQKNMSLNLIQQLINLEGNFYKHQGKI